MHIHRLEKIWLIFGISMLILFLCILGVQAFGMGLDTPNSHTHHSFDPTKINETPPFDQPALKQVGDQEYEAVMIAYAFGYTPEDIEVPVGSTVRFIVSSSDVVHGFEIPGTNVNLMAIPGEVNQVTHTFTKPGEYLILCNEYCGAAHHLMATKLIVR